MTNNMMQRKPVSLPPPFPFLLFFWLPIYSKSSKPGLSKRLLDVFGDLLSPKTTVGECWKKRPCASKRWHHIFSPQMDRAPSWARIWTSWRKSWYPKPPSQQRPSTAGGGYISWLVGFWCFVGSKKRCPKEAWSKRKNKRLRPFSVGFVLTRLLGMGPWFLMVLEDRNWTERR